MYQTTPRDGGLIAVPCELTRAWNRDLASALMPYYAQPAAMTTTSPREPFLTVAEIRAEDGRTGSL
jgi:hypothetical protein